MEELSKKYEARHLANMVAISLQVKALCNQMVQQFSRMANGYKYSDSSVQRTKPWFNNNGLKAEIDTYLNKFSNDLQGLLKKQIETSWLLAENKADAILVKILEASTIVTGGVAVYALFNRVPPVGNVLVSITGLAKDVANTSKTIVTLKDVMASPRNLEALTTFMNRKTAGLNLSERVWSLAEGNLNMISELLSNGILEGKSAAETSILLNQYLQDPNIFFRRVRNPLTGELEPSANALAYHRGKGVYKSSRANALRLAITETNMAYRRADHERRLLNKAVVGFEVVLSNEHPIEDICNDLVGPYPKDFIFTGFHPRCFCHTIDILLTPEELTRELQALLNGEAENLESINKVITVPDSFNAWVAKNQERAAGWANLPYFLQDNIKYAPGMEGLM